MIYTEVTDTEAYIILHADNSSTALAFRIPTFCRINDMRIDQDRYAYICGSANIGHKTGLVGKFDISGVFYNGESIQWGTYGYMPDSLVTVTDLKRLKLFHIGKTTAMAMVGDAIYKGILPTHTVASAYIDSVTNHWHEWYYSVKKAPIFTDIVCLDSAIVAVGSDSDSLGCYLKTFSPTLDFPAHPMVPNTVTEIVFSSPIGEVLATRFDGRTLTLAHYDKNEGIRTVFHDVTINGTSGRPISPVDTWFTDPASTLPFDGQWKLCEIITNSQYETWLLQQSAYRSSSFPGIANWLLMHHHIAATASHPAWMLPAGMLHSMDLDCTQMFPRLSGVANNLIAYQPSWQTVSTNCQSFEPITTKYDKAKVTEVASRENASFFNHLFTILPNVFTINANTICE